MIRPISFIRQDTCPICKSKRSIECYDTYNKPIRFSTVLDLIDKNKTVNLQSREFSYMKCIKCNTKFKLDWSYDREIPRPLSSNHILYKKDTHEHIISNLNIKN